MVRIEMRTKAMEFNLRDFDQEIDFLAEIQRLQRTRKGSRIRVRVRESHWPKERRYIIKVDSIRELNHKPKRVETGTGARFNKLEECNA